MMKRISLRKKEGSKAGAYRTVNIKLGEIKISLNSYYVYKTVH